jgi:hypothetical protein
MIDVRTTSIDAVSPDWPTSGAEHLPVPSHDRDRHGSAGKCR